MHNCCRKYDDIRAKVGFRTPINSFPRKNSYLNVPIVHIRSCLQKRSEDFDTGKQKKRKKDKEKSFLDER